MANLITQQLVIAGKCDRIAEIVRKHFQIEPDDPDPNRLKRVCLFYGFAADDDEAGYDMTLGATQDQVTAIPPVNWDGVISNPLHVFWCSHWKPTYRVPEQLVRRYPDIELEFTWCDLTNMIGEVSKSQNALMQLIEEFEVEF